MKTKARRHLCLICSILRRAARFPRARLQRRQTKRLKFRVAFINDVSGRCKLSRNPAGSSVRNSIANSASTCATHGCSDLAARLPNFSHACDEIGSAIMHARVPQIPRVNVSPVLLRGLIVRTRCNRAKFAKDPASNEFHAADEKICYRVQRK